MVNSFDMLESFVCHLEIRQSIQLSCTQLNLQLNQKQFTSCINYLERKPVILSMLRELKMPLLSKNEFNTHYIFSQKQYLQRSVEFFNRARK